MIRHIIWDVDGTLFDTYPSFGKAFKQAINDLGQDAPLDWIIEQARVSMDQCVEALAERCQLSAEEIEEKFSERYSSFGPQDQPPFESVIEICRAITLKGGKNLIVTHRRAAGLLRLLEHYELKEYFSGWITADDDYPKKPDPSAFISLIAKHGLDPAETLAVGDRDIDILAGQGAGLNACLFGSDTRGCKPDLTIRSFDELQRWLEQVGH